MTLSLPARLLSSRRSAVFTVATIAMLATLAQSVGFVPQAAEARTVSAAECLLSLSASQATVIAGQSSILTARASSDVEGSGSSIEIVDQTENRVINSCDTGVTCAAEVSVPSGGPHTYVAKLGNVSSSTVKVSRAAWAIGLKSDKSELEVGSTAHLTATSNQDVGATGGAYEIAILNLTAGRVLKTCASGQTCSTDSTDQYADDSKGDSFIAAVVVAGTSADAALSEDLQALSQTVSTSRRDWFLEVKGHTVVHDSGPVETITATTNQDLGHTAGRYAMFIFDVSTGKRLEVCAEGQECSTHDKWIDGADSLSVMTYVAAAGDPKSPREVKDIQSVANYTATNGADNRDARAAASAVEWKLSLTSAESELAAGQSTALAAKAERGGWLTELQVSAARLRY